MCGLVFQVFTKSRSEQQYNDTVKLLGQYISKNFRFASDMDVLVKEMKVPVLEKPDAPKDKTNETDVKIWEAEIKQFVDRKQKLQKNLKAAHAIIWGQCSSSMQGKIKSLTGYADSHKACDCIWLLKSIKGVAYRVQL